MPEKTLNKLDRQVQKQGINEQIHPNARDSMKITEKSTKRNAYAFLDKVSMCFSGLKLRQRGSQPHPDNVSISLDPFGNEADLLLQDLADNSEILQRNDTKHLGDNLPPRAEMHAWEKVFSTTKDGFSLRTLYRKTEKIDFPVLLVVEDVKGRVFGTLASRGFKVFETFYGDCDTCLFRFRPEFEAFKWSGENFYFIQGQENFLSVGSGDGKFGLWLDDNLYMGTTDKCSTFNSPPLIPEKEFKIKTLEVWKVAQFQQ